MAQGSFNIHYKTKPSRRLALSAAPVALSGADNAHAQAKENTKETTPDKSL